MATKHVYAFRKGDTTKIGLSRHPNVHGISESITTHVDPGDTVEWRLGNNSGLDNLEGIEKKESSPHNLIDGRVESGTDSNGNMYFYATIKSDGVRANQEETYTISYSIDGITYYDDPILKMKIGSGAGN